MASRVIKPKEFNTDIVRLILEDHKPLKKLIKMMKNLDRNIDERRLAFEEFSQLLVAHAKPEEQTLYVALKAKKPLAASNGLSLFGSKIYPPLREEGYEGEIEHNLADQLLKNAKSAKDKDLWSARVKVLAELVEHHIKEEESKIIPDFKKQVAIEQRQQIGKEYLQKKTAFVQGAPKSWSESQVRVDQRAGL